MAPEPMCGLLLWKKPVVRRASLLSILCGVLLALPPGVHGLLCLNVK